ncbi:MAG: putative hydrolase [Clostridia bacterium]|nr:putative hydrolase [Clostridia bacterium]
MFLETDLHTHTIASGHAYSTVKEMVEAAEKQNIKMIAITDHGIMMPGGPHEYHFYNMVAIPREIGNVQILRGVEAILLMLMEP